MPHKPGTGAIFGIVSEDGVAKSASPVYLLDMRRDKGVGEMRLLSKTLTRSDGGFTFAGLDTAYLDYAVTASDEDGAEPKNALIYDRVQPVPAHMGAGGLGMWYMHVMRDGAIAGFFSSPAQQEIASSDYVQVFGIHSRTHQEQAEALGAPTLAPFATPIPEYPNMNFVHLNTGFGLLCPGQMVQDTTDTDASIELLLDMDSIAAQTADCHMVYVQGSNYGSIQYSVSTLTAPSSAPASQAKLRLSITPAKLLSVKIAAEWLSAGTEIASFSLAALSGWKHIVVTFKSAESVNCYVDGVLFATASTTSNGASNALLEGAGHSMLLLSDLVDPDGTSNNRSYNIALAVAYNKTLKADEALNHYKALFDNDLIAPITGYARDILKDTPHQYWGMHDWVAADHEYFASTIGFFDDATGIEETRKRLNPSNITTGAMALIPSPITGRSAMSWVSPNNGDFRTTKSYIGWPFKNQGTFSCWVKFSNATPTAEETLVKCYFPDDETNTYFSVRRNTSGKLLVEVHEGTTQQTYTMTGYTPPANIWLYLAVVLSDKREVAPKVKLYAGDEAVAPALMQEANAATTQLYTAQYDSRLLIGSTEITTLAGGPDFAGSMCEIAMFPLALTLERIHEHWAAKDIV